MANEVVKDRLISVESVVVHPCLRSNQICDCLRVLASHNRVIQLEVVKRLCRVLEIELHHFYSIRERVERHFYSLRDRDELFLVVFNAVAGEECKGTDVFLDASLVFQIDGSKSSGLHVEKLGCVEHRLLLLSRHLIEEIAVVRVAHKVQAAVLKLERAHVSEHSTLGLLRADPRRKRVPHKEDRPVLLDLERLVLRICHCNHEGTLVGLISYGKLRVARQVDAIQLVKEVYKGVATQSVVNRHYADASLLKKLDVGARNITGRVLRGQHLFAVSIERAVQVAAHRLCQDTNYWSFAMIYQLLVLKVARLCNHVVLSFSLEPSLLEVCRASQPNVFQCGCRGEQISNREHSSHTNQP